MSPVAIRSSGRETCDIWGQESNATSPGLCTRTTQSTTDQWRSVGRRNASKDRFAPAPETQCLWIIINTAGTVRKERKIKIEGDEGRS